MRKIVIDLGFGDSGKGRFVSYLCSISDIPIVIRFSGGHQAGHTVVHNGLRNIKHIFSSFGSGTLQGIPTYWDKNCTFYPTAFLNELHVLKKKGIKPKIYVNGKCPVTTFCDVLYNQKIDKKNQHGSCGVGFGATLEREENHYSLLVEDLQHPSVVRAKLRLIMQYYSNIDKPISIFWNNLEDFEDVLNNITIVDDIDPYGMIIADGISISKFKDLIYEGSQGLMLDKNIGFFPHVTRANVGSKIIQNPTISDELYYITRAYQTRHGNGPMTNDDISHNIKENPDETNVQNFQGEFRRTLLDLDLLQYAIMKDNSKRNKSLVITCLDHVENDYRFTHKGEIITSLTETEFVNKIGDILEFDEIYTSNSNRGIVQLVER